MDKRALILVLTASLVLGGVARGDHRARAAFREASQHYNLGEFAQALELFKEAYRRYEDPAFLYNIAQCERQLGHKRDAIRQYRAFLRTAGGQDQEAVKQTIAELERQLAVAEARTPEARTPESRAAESRSAESRTAEARAAEPPVDAQAKIALAASPAPSSPRADLTASPHLERKPSRKKWWVLGVVGGVVVAGAAVGLAVALTRPTDPSAATTLGTAKPSF
jgi:tetratricopeptide (TPR) repeat protein